VTAGYDAVVLAGGRARRMGGSDKTLALVDGVPLLDRVLAAAATADRIVVVGDPRPVARPVDWTREEPPGVGPAAAVAAGVAHTSADVVVLLAADMPFVSTRTVEALVDVVRRDGTGAVLVDEAGNEQWLCSAWVTEALRGAPLRPHTSLRGALTQLPFARVAAAGEHPPPWFDCDTPTDLERARETT
jgi:molybdopterin-guanine dinucleotide biosynthesis protein A